jgi:hypothetical protein
VDLFPAEHRLTVNIGTMISHTSVTVTVTGLPQREEPLFNIAGTYLVEHAPWGSDNLDTELTVVNPAPPSSSPPLSISWTGADITLHWPISATGFALEATTNLAPSATWDTVTNTASEDGTWKWVILAPDPGNGARFFRLHKP